MTESLWDKARRYGYKPLARPHITTQGFTRLTGNVKITKARRSPEHGKHLVSMEPLAPGQASNVVPFIRPAPFAPNGIAGPKPTARFGPKRNPKGAQLPTLTDVTRRWAAATMTPSEQREIRMLGILAQKIILGFPIPKNPGTPTAAHYKQRTLEDFCVAIRSIARCVTT